MIVRVEAFIHCGDSITIPKKYTCDGAHVSPGITWSEVPPKTKGFALIMEDLDVPHRSNPLVLWIVYNIRGDLREIIRDTIPVGSKVGLNDLGKAEYSAPCPKPGTYQHRYQLQLYALDTELFLPNVIIDKQTLVKAMKGHILESALALATCERFKK